MKDIVSKSYYRDWKRNMKEKPREFCTQFNNSSRYYYKLENTLLTK